MISKLPTTSSDVLAQATQVAHNVYELLSIEQGHIAATQSSQLG